jgi:hypothetical protein
LADKDVDKILQEVRAIATTLLETRNFDSPAEKALYVTKIANRLRHTAAASLGTRLGAKLTEIINEAEDDAFSRRAGRSVERMKNPDSKEGPRVESIFPAIFDGIVGDIGEPEHWSVDYTNDALYRNNDWFDC